MSFSSCLIAYLKRINTMKTFTILYTGDDNQSHFREAALSYTQQFPDTDNQIFCSQDFPAKSCKLWTVKAGEEFHWVNAPCHQFIQVLQGRFQMEVGSGECREFTSNTLLRVEDCTGQGHISRILEDVVALIVVCDEHD